MRVGQFFVMPFAFDRRTKALDLARAFVGDDVVLAGMALLGVICINRKKGRFWSSSPLTLRG